jgi:hypothetical protein
MKPQARTHDHLRLSCGARTYTCVSLTDLEHFVIYYLLVSTSYLLLITFYLLLITYLFIIYYLLFMTYHLLLTYLLLITYYLLLITYYLLLITYTTVTNFYPISQLIVRPFCECNLLNIPSQETRCDIGRCYLEIQT